MLEITISTIECIFMIIVGLIIFLAAVYGSYYIMSRDVFSNIRERMKIRINKNYLIVRERTNDKYTIAVYAVLNYLGDKYLIELDDSGINARSLRHKLLNSYNIIDDYTKVLESIGYTVKRCSKCDISLIAKSHNGNFYAVDKNNTISYFGKICIGNSTAYGYLRNEVIELDTESIFNLN